MSEALFPDHPSHARRKIKRPVLTDADGTREGALVFPIVFIVGFVAASFVHPMALTSFWVWCGLLGMCVAVSVGVRRGMAQLYGYKDEDDTC